MDIFSFWDQGRAKAPKAVQICLDRWEELNPGHRLHVLDEADLRSIVTDLPFDVGLLPIQARSNILRIRLLRQHGGAWVDSTLLPLVPLDRWKDLYMGTTGLFMFAGRPAQWRLGNFFLLAEKGNHFIAALDDATRAYWTHPRERFDLMLPPTRPVGPRRTPRSLFTPGKGWQHVRFNWKWHFDTLYPVSAEGRRGRFYPYFWHHYLMMQLIQTDPKVRAIVDAMTYRNHELCHTVQHLRQVLGDDFPKAIPGALLCSPVQKLDWRLDWPDSIFEQPDMDRVLI